MLTVERLREVLHYDLETGTFTWLKPTSAMHHVVVGDKAGSRQNKGYFRVCIDNQRVMAHLLAWMYMTGEWPPHQVDHHDRNRMNNRWLNLRAATNKQNQENTGLRRDNTSGHKGVWWREDMRKWKAMIRHEGRLHTLGYFEEKADAVSARKAGEQKFFTHA